MSIFEEYPFLIPVISVIVALAGFLITFYYYRRQALDRRRIATDRVNSDNRVLSLQTESLAVEKRKEEESMARQIITENKRLALDVKESMVREFTGRINDLRSDLILQREILIGEMNLMKQTDKEIQKDLTYFVHNQQTINDRMQKNIDFMTQFMWGAGAKSIPPFVEGEIESQEHKDKPSEGLFMSPDSTETQATKDKTKSTKSEEIEQSKDEENEESKRKNPNL